MADTDETAEAVETSADVQETGGEKSYPDWLQGDPDPDRLVSYADNLRKERADLKERLAAWDDEESAFERVKEKFPHWLEAEDSEETDEDDDEFDEDDPRDQKLSELEARQKAHDEWIEQQTQRASLDAFNADLDELAAAKEVELDDDDRALILERSAKIGQETKAWDRSATEKALDWLIGKYEKREQQALERVKSSKRAPHVPAGGKAGKGPQPDLNTPEGQRAYVKQRLANS